MTKVKKLSRIFIALILVAIVLGVAMIVVAMIGSRAIFDEIEKLVPVEGRKLEFSKADEFGNNAFLKNDSSDQDFKVLQISDTHICASMMTIERDKAAVRAIAALVYANKPDFIVVTGDLIFTVLYNGSINNYIAVEAVGAIFEAFEIPWAVTFGNHDDDFTTMMNLSEQAKYYESLPHCLFSSGSEDIEGLGNYIVELRNFDGSLNTALFMFDCNAYDSLCSRYDYVRDGQVDWYKKQLEQLKTHYNKPVTSLVFVHIPLYEYRVAQELVNEQDPNAVLLRGAMKESISSTNKVEGKLFDAILQMKSTVGVFCGHDHINNSAIRYKGVTLAYGMSIDYVAYPGIHKQTKQRGGQLIYINKNETISIALVRQDNDFLPDQAIVINGKI